MGVKQSFIAPSRAFVVRWAWASLAANIGIIVTGAIVRLTGSGLGCPTWPRCTADSFVPHRALGINGVIEFGNRMLTYVLVAVAIATAVAVWRWAGSDRVTRRLVIVLGLGIPFQGVIGGITVLTDLNPWVVALHLLLSFALVSGSVLLIVRVSGPGRADADSPDASGPAMGRSTADRSVMGTNLQRTLTLAIYAVSWIVVYLGTVVTGSGPHAGDASAPRNGLDPQVMSHVHAAAVYVLVALTLLAVWMFRGSSSSFGWAFVLLLVEMGQGAVGFIQYWNGLPIPVVALHLFGAAVLMAVSTRLLLSTSNVRSAAPTVPH